MFVVPTYLLLMPEPIQLVPRCQLFLLCLLYNLFTSSANNVSVAIAKTSPNPPVALQDIGFDGTWEQFCDREQIDKDFAFYLEHELRTLRYLICDMVDENEISRDTMSPFIAYKYCEMMRFRVDVLLEKLVTRLADDDDNKEKMLLSESPYRNETSCFRTVVTEFEAKCINEKNPYLRMFKPLLARACNSDWLKTENISLSLHEICADEKLSGDIDWKTIIHSVPYRE